MRGVYNAQVDIAALSTAKTVLLLVCPSTIIIEILHVDLTNLSNNIAEQLKVAFSRVTTIGSPVSGTSVNIQKSEPGSPTTALTVYGDLTTEPSSYDSAPIDSQGVVNLGGYYYDPIFECRPSISPSKAVGLRLLNAPSTAFRCVGQIIYREIG